MRSLRVPRTLTLTLALLLFGFAAHAQTLIDQAAALAGGITAGDTPGFPVTLNEAGSYRLTGNLDAGTTNAIVIGADDVHIDLGGFTVSGSGTSASGIGASGGSDRTTIVNGTVRGFGGTGIELDDDAHVRDVRVFDNGGDGIFLVGGIVSDCTISRNGSTGILVAFGNDVIIRGNTIHHNGDRGIYERFSTGGLVIDNQISVNGGPGMQFDGGSATGYGNNVLLANGGSAQVIGGSQLGPNLCNGVPCP